MKHSNKHFIRSCFKYLSIIVLFLVFIGSIVVYVGTKTYTEMVNLDNLEIIKNTFEHTGHTGEVVTEGYSFLSVMAQYSDTITYFSIILAVISFSTLILLIILQNKRNKKKNSTQ